MTQEWHAQDSRRHLKGARNQCPGCGAYFTSQTGFERHRVGAYGSSDNPRRCEFPGNRGMHLGDDGYWRLPGGYWTKDEP